MGTFRQRQIATAISNKSSSEWKHWTVVYARFLVMCCNSPNMAESCKRRVNVILEELLGPTVELDEMGESDEKKSWSSHMMGVDKRVFLKTQILPLLQKSVNLQ